MKNLKPGESLHNRLAPFWAAAMILALLAGLGTTWVSLGSFWNGYVLDIAGPAWSYILFRGLFTEKSALRWFRIFTPVRTFIILVFVSTAIEMAQYFKLYAATFDPYDFLAYNSLLVPFFLLDLLQERKE